MSELHDLLEDLAGVETRRGATAVFEAATVQARRRRRTRRRVRLVSVLAAGLAIVLIAVPLLHDGGTTKPHVLVGPDDSPPVVSGATAAQLARGHWSTIPLPPVYPRPGAVSVWTGSELIVWGGVPQTTVLSDSSRAGDAYDPATRVWRKLPLAPIELREGGVAVWTGTEMVVSDGRKAAAYAPALNAWRLIADPPPSKARYTIGVWTGDRVVLFAGGGAEAAAYDPTADRWRELPVPGPTHGPLGWQVAVRSGRGQLVAWSVWSTQKPTGSSSYEGSGGSGVFSYDEKTDAWTVLDPGAVAISIPEEAIWTGTRVLVRGDMHMPGAYGPGPLPEVSAWYDPATGTWEWLPADALTDHNLPASFFSSAWTGRALFSFNGQTEADNGKESIRPGDASAFDPVGDSWQRLPRSPFACDDPMTPVWTGSSVIVYCSRLPAERNLRIGGLEFVPGPAEAAP
jgi:hypothetical protein